MVEGTCGGGVIVPVILLRRSSRQFMNPTNRMLTKIADFFVLLRGGGISESVVFRRVGTRGKIL